MKQIILLTLLLFAMAAALSACGGGSTEATPEKEAVQAGETVEQAIARLTAALQADPENVRALYSRGVAYIRQGDYQKAVDDLDEARFLQVLVVGSSKDTLSTHEFARLVASQGLAYAGAGKLAFGRSTASEAAFMYREDPWIFYNHGTIFMLMNSPVSAVQDDAFDMAIELDPNYTEAYVQRAYAYTLQGEHDKARQDVEKAVTLGVDRATIEAEVERLKVEGVPEFKPFVQDLLDPEKRNITINRD